MSEKSENLCALDLRTPVRLLAILTALLLLWPAVLEAEDREAPNITGMAVQGVSVNLNYFRGAQNVLVVFYRTQDCPFCRAQLAEMQEYYDEFRDLGAELVALSADSPVDARQVVLDLGLKFPVLSDSYRSFIRAYDVLHPQEGLARPAAFVVDREGKIRWQYVGMSVSDRPPVREILAALRAVR